MKFASVYGSGAAMGFTPRQVNEMSMWQYFAALNGYIEANSSSESRKLSTSEAEDLLDWVYEGYKSTIEYRARVYIWDDDGFVLDESFTFH